MPSTACQPTLYKRVARKVIREIDAGDFWSWLNDSNKGRCTAIMRTDNEQMIGDIILEYKDAFMEQTRSQRDTMDKREWTTVGKKRGDKGKGKGKAEVPAKGKGKGKASPKTSPKTMVTMTSCTALQ